MDDFTQWINGLLARSGDKIISSVDPIGEIVKWIPMIEFSSNNKSLELRIPGNGLLLQIPLIVTYVVKFKGGNEHGENTQNRSLFILLWF